MKGASLGSSPQKSPSRPSRTIPLEVRALQEARAGIQGARAPLRGGPGDRHREAGRDEAPAQERRGHWDASVKINSKSESFLV